jgi:hypothetical protein
MNEYTHMGDVHTPTPRESMPRERERESHLRKIVPNTFVTMIFITHEMKERTASSALTL